MLSGGTGPLIPVSQSRRGCWEQAVLGNDLADRGLRMERVKEEELKSGADRGEEKMIQSSQEGWRRYEAGNGETFTARKM